MNRHHAAVVSVISTHCGTMNIKIAVPLCLCLYDVISKYVNQCKTTSVCFYSCRRTTFWSVHATPAAMLSQQPPSPTQLIALLFCLLSFSCPVPALLSVHKFFSTSKNCNTEPSWVVYDSTGHYLDCVQFPAGVRFQPVSRLQRPHSVLDVFIRSYLNLWNRKAFLNI